ncbi:cytochrome P450 CYP736A12-like [Rutidosis leptorrhynchoides]|uniref:cytochrome P450 CYP736A12-like n=1 Tax=Rutidosis leptorrhynchoides TaxID=125765 RepID=UPI003A9A181D
MVSFTLVPLFILTGIILRWCYSTHIHRKTSPPGPFPLPIIGNLHLLGKLPHCAFYKLSQRYGPIMSIHLGSINCVVVSSPDGAKLFFGTHDAILTSRPKLELAKYLYYGNKGILLTEGEYWRNVRKLCTMELFTPMKINGFAKMRNEEIKAMIKDVKVWCLSSEIVNLGEFVGRVIEGMTCRMLFGFKNDKTFVFKKLVDDVAEALGTKNLADFIPMLKPFDLQGLVPQFKSLSKNIDAMLETLINEQEKRNASMIQRSDEPDFLDILLSVKDKYSTDDKNPSNAIDRSSIKALLIDVISGSIDTSRSTIEWVLSNLVKHPRVMKKLQNEIKNVVGDKSVVEETDLEKLSYLHMVIKETFRLYPVVPLLMPHVSTQDVVINGYYIPKETHVYVNVWAFGRDPSVWSENWAEFVPERFDDKEIDFRGPNFQLMISGTGRRGCPAMNLGLLNVGLIVSNLVHCFDWMLPNDMSPSELDMDDKFTLSMCKLNSLVAIPTERIVADVLGH